MSYFAQSRNVELSTIYYLETQIDANWSGISVVKSFTNAYKEALPVVSIRAIDLDPNPKEIGNTSLITGVSIAIDLFCTSDGQRLDLAYFITDKLKDPWVYYIHSQTSGAPETLSRTEDGKIRVEEWLNNNIIDFGTESADKYDLHRHFILVRVKKT